MELKRGLDDDEDRLFAGQFHCQLHAGESVTIVLSTEENASLDGEDALTSQSAHELNLFQQWQAHHGQICGNPAEEEPSWLWQLVLAADQFLVRRVLPDEADGRSIIAGYPWFNDWGRDTMIALPGLTLATGRRETTRKILLSLVRYVDEGI